MSNIVKFPNKSRDGVAFPIDGDFPRWKATITYRSRDGRKSQVETFEELEELHHIIESGPNFYCIETIVVCLNPEAAPERINLEDADEFEGQSA